ncbi:MAG: redoxin domain-containing protein [Planctomycetota bacterium]
MLLVAGVLLLVLAAVFHQDLLGLATGGHRAARVAIGEKVPDFSVTDAEGKVWKLSDLQKRTASGVVSLTFWCTFCHSCRHLDAYFQTVATAFQGEAAVLGIDASAADTVEKVEGFRAAKEFSVPVFMDTAGDAADLFGVRVTTTTVVIDKAGILRYRGQFGTASKPYVPDALQAVLEGKEVSVQETSPAG